MVLVAVGAAVVAALGAGGVAVAVTRSGSATTATGAPATKTAATETTGATAGTATTAASPSVPATSASAKPTATTTAAANPPAGGWVSVDGAAWKKELALYDAVAPVAVPAGTTKVPEFHTDCKVSTQGPDDPIVFPNLPGASHLHTFFGPSVNAGTTPADIAAEKTSCTAPGDHSAYWVPQMLRNGKPVPIKSFRVYYGAKIADSRTVKPFPPGLVMVQGDAKRQVATPKGASGQFWCAGSAETGRSKDGNWPVCASGGNLIYQLTFQDCWDGKHIDSPDHLSHMGPSVGGVCKGKYPVAVPSVSLMVNYQSLGGDGLRLSSGMASSMHGDFMMGWTPKSISAMVKVCLNQGYKCGDSPTFVGG